MGRYNGKEVVDTMFSVPLVPVFYSPDIEVTKKVMKACYDGGVRLFEFTNRGDKASEVFAHLVDCSKELPGMILGAGSISFPGDARKFIRMGASFIVGPQYVPSVMRVCRFRSVPYIPGCGTVSEVGRAQRAGCAVCKVFPGDVLGPKFIKALKAPMPWSRIMVTGGVKPEKENIEGWMKAGAGCLGMGSNLFPKEMIDSGDWEGISKLCRSSLAMIDDTIKI